MYVFIGLEIHIQLSTQSKIFCGCKNQFGDQQNTNICPVCMGYPGTLPVLNQEAVFLSYVVAQSLQCQLAESLRMERKNYFYPDLPKNYQISQFGQPIGSNGHFVIAGSAGEASEEKRDRQVRIREVHLEEDAGKLVHIGDNTLCDYNRAGTPLLEVVTEPDISTGLQAESMLRQFQRFVRYLGVCDGDMEKGSMRCDANVSVNTENVLPDYRVEIKNLNSPRFVRKALDYEIARLQELRSSGQVIEKQTRLWNENRDRTELLRQKENAQDYRYFREPDLPIFSFDAPFFERVSNAMVESPQSKKQRFIDRFQLTEEVADLLCSERSFADLFEQLLAGGIEAKIAANWLTVDIRQQLRHHGQSLGDGTFGYDQIFELLSMLQDGEIHGKMAKKLLEQMFRMDKGAREIMREQGWEAMTDGNQLLQMVRDILQEQQEFIAESDLSDKRVLSFLMGQVMKKSQGNADPRAASEILRKELETQGQNKLLS